MRRGRGPAHGEPRACKARRGPPRALPEATVYSFHAPNLKIEILDLQRSVVETQIWRSIFRVGIPNTNRKRVLAMLGNVVLHLHPVKTRKSGVKMRYTWCAGGMTFFLFLVLTFTGLLLMFYYRPTIEYAYGDMIDLREQVPFGVMREMHDIAFRDRFDRKWNEFTPKEQRAIDAEIKRLLDALIDAPDPQWGSIMNTSIPASSSCSMKL